MMIASREEFGPKLEEECRHSILHIHFNFHSYKIIKMRKMIKKKEEIGDQKDICHVKINFQRISGEISGFEEI